MEDPKPDWLSQMEGILEALNEGVMIVDDCNQMLFVNDRLVEMTPFSREEILGRTPAHFYSGDDLKFLMEQIARGEEQGSNRFEFYLVGPGHVPLPVIISSRVIEDPDGRRFAVVTFTDIRTQRHAQQQLEQANAQLEKRQREIETELALASRVQQSLAPRGLRWGRVVVETFYLPVRTIGGDFGVVTPGSDTQLNLLVCDVSGHGIGSALVANRIYSETLSLLERQTELGEMLQRLNRFVLQQIRLTGFFFTMAVARLGDSGRRMDFAGAGHPPAIWLSPSGECRLLGARSAVLGCLDDPVVPEPVEAVELSPGDRLVLYTDGFTDVFDHRGEILGVEGFTEIVRATVGKPLAESKEAILTQVSARRDGPITDDMSLVLLELH